MKFPDSVLLHKELENKKVVRKIGDANILPHPNCTLKYACHLQSFIIALFVLCMYRLKLLLHLRKIKIACFYVIPVIPQEIHFSSYWIEFV